MPKQHKKFTVEVNSPIEKYYFRAIPIWDILSKEVCEKLNEDKILLNYKKNVTILHDFEYSAGIYSIKKGFIKIYAQNATGGEDIVFLLGKGLIFGVAPLFNNEKSGVFVTTITDCEIELIPKESVKKAQLQSFELNQAIILYLAQVGRMLNIKLLDFARKPLAKRVALTLLILDKKLSLNGTLAFSREDLANYMGTAVESLVRQLKKLKTENIISVKGRKITIIDYARLIKLASETP